MGRNKIKIEKIENSRIRQVTFYKRKKGLIKKSMELSLLCEAKILLCVLDKNEKMTTYISDSETMKDLEEYFINKHIQKENLSNKDYRELFLGNNKNNSNDSKSDDEDLERIKNESLTENNLMSIKEQGMNLNESRFLQADKNNDENGNLQNSEELKDGIGRFLNMLKNKNANINSQYYFEGKPDNNVEKLQDQTTNYLINQKFNMNEEASLGKELNSINNHVNNHEGENNQILNQSLLYLLSSNVNNSIQDSSNADISAVLSYILNIINSGNLNQETVESLLNSINDLSKIINIQKNNSNINPNVFNIANLINFSPDQKEASHSLERVKKSLLNKLQLNNINLNTLNLANIPNSINLLNLNTQQKNPFNLALNSSNSSLLALNNENNLNLENMVSNLLKNYQQGQITKTQQPAINNLETLKKAQVLLNNNVLQNYNNQKLILNNYNQNSQNNLNISVNPPNKSFSIDNSIFANLNSTGQTSGSTNNSVPNILPNKKFHENLSGKEIINKKRKRGESFSNTNNNNLNNDNYNSNNINNTDDLEKLFSKETNINSNAKQNNLLLANQLGGAKMNEEFLKNILNLPLVDNKNNSNNNTNLFSDTSSFLKNNFKLLNKLDFNQLQNNNDKLLLLNNDKQLQQLQNFNLTMNDLSGINNNINTNPNNLNFNQEFQKSFSGIQNLNTNPSSIKSTNDLNNSANNNLNSFSNLILKNYNLNSDLLGKDIVENFNIENKSKNLINNNANNFQNNTSSFKANDVKLEYIKQEDKSNNYFEKSPNDCSNSDCAERSLYNPSLTLITSNNYFNNKRPINQKKEIQQENILFEKTTSNMNKSLEKNISSGAFMEDQNFNVNNNIDNLSSYPNAQQQNSYSFNSYAGNNKLNDLSNANINSNSNINNNPFIINSNQNQNINEDLNQNNNIKNREESYNSENNLSGNNNKYENNNTNSADKSIGLNYYSSSTFIQNNSQSLMLLNLFQNNPALRNISPENLDSLLKQFSNSDSVNRLMGNTNSGFNFNNVNVFKAENSDSCNINCTNEK